MSMRPVDGSGLVTAFLFAAATLSQTAEATTLLDRMNPLSNLASADTVNLRGNAAFEWVTSSRDGSRVVVGGADPRTLGAPPRVLVLDPKNASILSAIDAHASRPIVSDDAGLVVAAPPPGNPPGRYVVETAGGRVAGFVPESSDSAQPGVERFAMQVLGFSPGARELVIATGSRISVWDFRSGQLLGSVDVGAPPNKWGATRSPDGRYFAVHVVLDLSTSKPLLFDVQRRTLKELPFSGKWVQGFAFSRDGETLAIGGERDIELHHLPSGTIRRTAACPHPRNQFLDPKGFSLDGRVLVAAGDKAQLCVFNALDGRLLGVGNSANASGYDQMVVSLDASRAVVQRSNDHFEVWSTLPAKLVVDIVPDHASNGGREHRAHGLSADGTLLFISDRWGCGAWDARTGQRRASIDDTPQAPATRPPRRFPERVAK